MIRKSIFILSFIIIAFAGNVFSQQVTAKAKLDSNNLLIGDQVKLKVQLSYPSKTIIAWPDIKDTLTKHIEIVKKSKIDTISKDPNKLTLAQTLVITCFDSGGFYIPQIPFGYKNPGDTAFNQVLTDSILLNVKNIPVDTTKAFKDIKGPMGVPWTLKEMLPYILGAILLAAIIWFIIYYLRKRKKGESLLSFSKPKRPAHEEALLALEELRNKKLWQNNKVKEYYVELTEITRNYIEKRYGVIALEMTTDEIISALSPFSIKDELKKKLRQTFVLADLVKFAKAFPLPNEHDTCLDTAIEFVKETKPVEVQQPTEEKVVIPLMEIKKDQNVNGGPDNAV
ncbi:MAG: hypothetical protein ABR968_07715 [Bacteroidales bacterium]